MLDGASSDALTGSVTVDAKGSVRFVSNVTLKNHL